VQFLKQKLVQESSYNNSKNQNRSCRFFFFLWKYINIWVQRKAYESVFKSAQSAFERYTSSS